MPELKASPRNRYLGLLADALSGAKSAADTVQLPVVGGLGSLLFGDAPELVNDVAYYGPQALVRGGNAATGGLGTFAPDRRVLDAIGVAPMAPGAMRAAKTVANPMTYGRAFMEAQAPAVMSPITAFHGTPHKFNKFKLEKIGSGEGAQAYGHGLYFADDPKVAQQYQKDLSKGGDLINGKPITDFYDMISQRADRLPMEKAQVEYEKMNFLEDLMQSGDFNAAVKRVDDEQAAKWAMGLQDKWTPAGNFYKVDIPDESVANMLLWDKPLSEQPEAVRKAVKDFADLQGIENYIPSGTNSPVLLGRGISGDTLGSDIYRLFGDKTSPKEASGNLNAFGIPGIRYLDAGSRGQGVGTMNTVVFDDSIIKILERNGVPLGLLAD